MNVSVTERKASDTGINPSFARRYLRTVATTLLGLCVLSVLLTGYNSFTTESVPAPGDKHTQVTWYWEPGHFRPSLGDAIIARIYGRGDTGFGSLLTSPADPITSPHPESSE